MRLKGKVALVTGAGRGIGRAIALGYAGEGADLVLTARTARDVQETARQVQALGRRALPLALDVCSTQDAATAVLQCLAAFGRLDILVNNAGTTVVGPTVDLAEAEWDQVMDTNLKGTFLMSQAAARVMLPAGAGVIINIGSICSVVGLPGRAAYCASKGGVVLLTRALAAEWAPHGVRVNCLAPGFIRTEGHEALVARGVIRREALAAATPAQRVGGVEEVVGPAIFLASDEAAFMHGELMLVDGGWVADGHVPPLTQQA